MVYFYTKSVVVKTSALDSVGDLIANFITMFTGIRMSQVDLKKYPVGQSRFEPIGCLIFATLMATMMFGNFLENFEELLSGDELSREEAVKKFWEALFGTHQEEEGGVHTWLQPEVGFNTLRQLVVDKANALPAVLKAAVIEPTFTKATEAIEYTIHQAAEVEHAELQKRKLIFQNCFLALCAMYKLCLWQFCVVYAIPKTGSFVLKALATDKRNDFIATSSVILITWITYIAEDSVSTIIDPEKVDPLTSLALSSVIIYFWVLFLMEEVICLSAPTAKPDFIQHISSLLQRELAQESMRDKYSCEVRAYFSSRKCTVEVDLIVRDPEPFEEVALVMDAVRRTCSSIDGVERAVVVPKYAPQQ